MLAFLIIGLLAMKSIDHGQNLMSGHKNPVLVCPITCRPFMRHSIPKSHEHNPDSTVTFIISLNLGPWWNYWHICLRWRESQLKLALHILKEQWEHDLGHFSIRLEKQSLNKYIITLPAVGMGLTDSPSRYPNELQKFKSHSSCHVVK